MSDETGVSIFSSVFIVMNLRMDGCFL
jgi:predicted  nucleic acid-binding Zn-ribbon protein